MQIYNFLKKGRLAIHKIKIARLIKVKSKVNVNVRKNSLRNMLDSYSLFAIKRFPRKILQITSTLTIIKIIK